MGIYYKLTDQDGYTRRDMVNELRWDVGVTHKAKAKGRMLCTDRVIHLYYSPELALLLNPIHAGIINPRLWRVQANVVAAESKLKAGAKQVKVIEELQVPNILTIQKVYFGIICAQQVYKEISFIKWANNWINGVDRSSSAALAALAALAAHATLNAAAHAAARAAARAARAAHAAHAAAHAAHAALNAAAHAEINLIKLARQAAQFQG